MWSTQAPSRAQHPYNNLPTDDAVKLSQILRDIDQFKLDRIVANEIAVDSSIHAIQNTIKEERLQHTGGSSMSLSVTPHSLSEVR
ncbi:hypothetical protein PILCRDRAFT_10555 [Piloderma croceum F 1598]|uniref:Uncharacterized protein n=1 Tax=Piloderma croceum (strain F 1598) TaxID=765440 RepID=A0A0C3FHT2_PILCF|nr:hypothetical protein PILCRDRAFT_10555 [Piloderma croceum F 1598]